MKTALKVMLGILLAGCVLMVGCALLVGGAVNEVQKESDAHSITRAQFDSIQVGTSKSAVIDRLGEPDPDSIQDTSSTDLQGGTAKSSCIYYTKRGEIVSRYQFCFDGAKLQTKASY